MRALPLAVGRWALDSGGFTEITSHGQWTIAPDAYASAVRRYHDEIGGLDWAAVQDWLCIPPALAKSGLTVAEHQARTIRSLVELRSIAPDLPWAPVLQGAANDDYFRHADAYTTAGFDLATEPVVMVGSIVKAQATQRIGYLIERLASDGLRLHGLGVKKAGLARIGERLTSADSLAWSWEARNLRRPSRPQCARRSHCGNCLHYALAWREQVLATVGLRPVQYEFTIA